MIEPYLDAAIRQARERARHLKGKIPQPVKSAEFVALQQLCESRLDSIIGKLDYLLADRTILLKDLVKERMRIFRRTLGELSELETTAITALTRVHDDDVFMNKLVFEIHREIQYPLSPPTATCLSRDYFATRPAFQLVEVPLAESDFLLHLPDLYHELGHLLIATTNNPKVEPFQLELGRFLGVVNQHFDSERVFNARATGPNHAQALDALERFWMYWANEIFCDLYGVYTVGPAFAWAHFHLTAGHEGDPYDVRLTRFMSHPPDQARMDAMLVALDLVGFKEEATRIRSAWSDLLSTLGVGATPMYRRACPAALLERAAIGALEGTKKTRSRIVCRTTTGLVHDSLNAAWREFWNASAEYERWERGTMDSLRKRFCTG